MGHQCIRCVDLVHPIHLLFNILHQWSVHQCTSQLLTCIRCPTIVLWHTHIYFDDSVLYSMQLLVFWCTRMHFYTSNCARMHVTVHLVPKLYSKGNVTPRIWSNQFECTQWTFTTKIKQFSAGVSHSVLQLLEVELMLSLI